MAVHCNLIAETNFPAGYQHRFGCLVAVGSLGRSDELAGERSPLVWSVRSDGEAAVWNAV